MNKTFWKDKRVFVTGCTGLLGSWLSEKLIEEGAELVGLVRDSEPKSNLLLSGTHKKMILVRGELEDYFLLERILNEYEINVVFHLGAQTIVSIANRNPLSTFDSNIKGTWNILEACRRVKRISAILVASSDKAYGEQKKLPYSESSPLKGFYPYDVSKSCADLIAYTYFKTYDLPIGIVRCGNFYGGGDLNFNRIVPGTIRSIINSEQPIIRSDGTLIRDYIYIKDAVSAYLTFAKTIGKGRFSGEAINFSNGTPLSVIKIVDKIRELTNRKDLKPVILKKEAGNEIKAQYLLSEKAQKLLKWKPEYSVNEGLKETINWYRDFFAKE